MSFGTLTFTSKGTTLQAKSQTGAPLHFTRIAMGDGVLGQTVITGMNSLIHEVKSLSLNKMTAAPDGQMILGAYFSNKNLTGAFPWREIGVFANDPELGEILYCYGNAGTTPENIPLQIGSDLLEKQVDVIVMIGSATNVSATINESLVYASKPELMALKSEVDAKETPTGAQVKINEALASIKRVLPSNYYVNGTTGNDNNDGLTVGTAFKTIMKAVGKIPSILNGDVQITVADGTYPEALTINNKLGGVLTLKGNATTPTNVKVMSISTSDNQCHLIIQGFEVTTSTLGGVTSNGDSQVIFDNIRVNTAAMAYYGIIVYNGKARIQACNIMSRAVAIYAGYNATVMVFHCTGSGSAIGIQSDVCSTLSYVCSIPTGITPIVQTNGGVVLNNIKADTLDGIDSSGFLKTAYEVITDGNLAVDPSKTYYCTYNGSNIPPVCQEWFVTVQIHENGNLHQVWHSFNTDQVVTYERIRSNGVWSYFRGTLFDCGNAIAGSVDVLTTPGRYRVVNVTNCPLGYVTNDNDFFLEVFKTISYDWVRQIMRDVRSSRTFERSQLGGNWQPWVEQFHSGNHDVNEIIYGSITLTNAHNGKVLYFNTPAAVTVSIPLSLDQNFGCTFINYALGGATTFVPLAGVALYSNVDNTKRSLNGSTAFGYLRKYKHDAESYFLGGNLKV